MRYLSVVNLAKYQHYSKRNPPWVKLHREAMTDYTLRSFTVPTRFLFAMLWLIASENGNRIPYDMKWLGERIGMSVTDALLLPLLTSQLLTTTSPSVSVSVSPLSLTENSNMLADCEQDARKMLAEELTDFAAFWEAYPRKEGRKAAQKAWRNAKDKPAISDIIQAIKRAQTTDQWTKEGGQFIPHPSSWLNKGRWSDQPLPNGHAITLSCPHHPTKIFTDAKEKRIHDQIYHPKFEG